MRRPKLSSAGKAAGLEEGSHRMPEPEPADEQAPAEHAENPGTADPVGESESASQESDAGDEPDPAPEPQPEPEPQLGPEPEPAAVIAATAVEPEEQQDPVWVAPAASAASAAPAAIQPGRGYPAFGAARSQDESGPAADLYLGMYSDAPAESVAGTPVDPAKRRRRKRVLWTVAAVVAAAALVTGGVIALLPGRTGNSVVAEVACKPSDLSSCLIKAPDGAVRLTAADPSDKWPQETAVSAELFASNIVDDSPGIGSDVTTELTADGMHSIVHTDWNAVDGDDVDIALLDFATQKGAQEWNANRAGEILAAYPGQTVGIPGDSTGAAHVAAKKDAKGVTHAAYSVAAGDIVLNVAYSSPNTFDAQDLETWAGTELASLHKAPPAPADPAPAAPGTQQVACSARITSCLMPVPDGGQPWTDPTDKHWSGSSTLTSSQLAHLFWDGDSSSVQDSVLSDFNADGVTGIGHEAWTLDDADEQADIYLIQTITANGAQQLASERFGEPQWSAGVSGLTYSIPGEPDAQAWYSNKPDKNGFTDFTFTQAVGNVLVVGWLYFYGSLDHGLTDSWAQAQLNKVTATAKTEPMGLFPLTAPALPAAVQGGCGTSTGCLIPLPSGATDTTASSYQSTQNLSAEEYAGQYESYTGSDFGQWLGSDGFQGGEHRSWTASNGATADAVVLKYTSSAQAKAAALLEFGINANADRVCTDAAMPDSWCLATSVETTDNLQKETIWVVAWKGDYEVGVSVTVDDAADLAQAYGWAEQQLDMLSAS